MRHSEILHVGPSRFKALNKILDRVRVGNGHKTRSPRSRRSRARSPWICFRVLAMALANAIEEIRRDSIAGSRKSECDACFSINSGNFSRSYIDGSVTCSAFNRKIPRRGVCPQFDADPVLCVPRFICCVNVLGPDSLLLGQASSTSPTRISQRVITIHRSQMSGTMSATLLNLIDYR